MRKVIILSLALILMLGIMSSGTSSYFSDTEGLTTTACCWTTECEDTCGTHYIVLVDHTFDGTYSTWTYEVTSGSSPALSHWVLEWECDCSAVIAVYENGVPIPYGEGGWECGKDPTTGVWGIKFENGYANGETRTVTIVLLGDYEQGRVTIGMKAGTVINVCEACGPVCEAPCPYGSMILVSGLDTQVTQAYTWYNNQQVTATNTPHAAVLAQHPTPWERDWDNNRITYNGQPYTFSDGAQWIWETWRTDEPSGWLGWPSGWHGWPSSSVTGRVARFVRTFDIPCSPAGAELYITVDNGYSVWVNGHLVGSAQVYTGWETHTLTENYVHTSNWSTVERYPIPASYLVEGTNTIEILAANEYMGNNPYLGYLDGQDDGTWNTNPAGLIYWLEVEWGD